MSGLAQQSLIREVPATAAASPVGFNLLRISLVRRIATSVVFPYALQAILLLGFLALAVIGWGLYAPEGVASKLFAKANLVNLLVWGIWWPAMIWLAVLFGRLWCAVCPLELVSNASERMGRRLGVRQRRIGKLLSSGALILVIYALIQLLVAGVELHRVPAYTSLLLCSLLAAAALTGLFLRDRAFCRGFCPVGLLLGTYGRGAMLAVRPTSPEPCASCTDKGCVRASDRAKLDARSCPSLLNPARLDSSSDCLVCGQCLKSCGPGNMGLYLRRPFHPADVRPVFASWPVTLFAMLVSGFVAYELCSEWAAAKHVFLWVPDQAVVALGWGAYEGWIRAVWMLFLFPTLSWTLLGLTALAFGGASSLRDSWRRLALPLVVLIAAGHMAKGLAKVASWGGFLPHALRDPAGSATAPAWSDGSLAPPAALLPMTFVSAIVVMVLVLMTGYALRESRLADAANYRGRIVPIAVTALTIVSIVVGWGVFA